MKVGRPTDKQMQQAVLKCIRDGLGYLRSKDILKQQGFDVTRSQFEYVRKINRNDAIFKISIPAQYLEWAKENSEKIGNFIHEHYLRDVVLKEKQLFEQLRASAKTKSMAELSKEEGRTYRIMEDNATEMKEISMITIGKIAFKDMHFVLECRNSPHMFISDKMDAPVSSYDEPERHILFMELNPLSNF